ncbi:MAG: metalloregulator ArsR/SmtB family transcription factor [Desulfobacteraceae bacterium]|jgi:DNA-binding transcriptional ArsR family regulator
MRNLTTLAELFKALADTTRLRLVKLLLDQTIVFCGGDCDGRTFLCVGALANKLNVTQSAVSQHLRVLRQVGLVKKERRGTFMHYSIDPEGIERFRLLVGQTMGDNVLSG